MQWIANVLSLSLVLAPINCIHLLLRPALDQQMLVRFYLLFDDVSLTGRRILITFYMYAAVFIPMLSTIVSYQKTHAWNGDVVGENKRSVGVRHIRIRRQSKCLLIYFPSASRNRTENKVNAPSIYRLWFGAFTVQPPEHRCQVASAGEKI